MKRPINVSLNTLNAHLIYCNRIFLYFSDKLFKPEFLANKWTSLILKFHSVDYEVSLASLEDPSLLIYTCQLTSTAWEWIRRLDKINTEGRSSRFLPVFLLQFAERVDNVLLTKEGKAVWRKLAKSSHKDKTNRQLKTTLTCQILMTNVCEFLSRCQRKQLH